MKKTGDTTCLRWIESLLAAFVCWGLGRVTCCLLEVAPDSPVLLLLAGCTFLVYTLDAELPYSPEDHRSYSVIRLAPFVGGAVVATAWSALIFRKEALFGVAILAAISVLYMLPILPGNRRLKDLPMAKTAIVSIGWGISTVLIPALQSAELSTSTVFWLLAYRIAFLVPNILASDWPDRSSDREAGIRTPANSLSNRQFLMVCRSAAAAAAAIAILAAIIGVLPAWILADAVGVVIASAIIGSQAQHRPAKYRLLLDVVALWPLVPALIAQILLG